MPQNAVLKSIRRILPQRKKSGFGAIDIYPRDIRFATQDSDEYIFIKLRSHIIVNFGWMFRGIFAALLPLIIVLIWEISKLMFDAFLPDLGIATGMDEISGLVLELPVGVWLIMGVIYYSTLVSYAFINFLNWYFNIYLVTNHRVVHFQFKAFTGKAITETPLTKIEDISQRIVGVFPSIFHYGDIRVQTAATKSNFFFKNVPDPTWFRDVLADLIKLVKSDEP